MIRALLSMALMALDYFMASRRPADTDEPAARDSAHDAADPKGAAEADRPATAAGEREERR